MLVVSCDIDISLYSYAFVDQPYLHIIKVTFIVVGIRATAENLFKHGLILPRPLNEEDLRIFDPSLIQLIQASPECFHY